MVIDTNVIFSVAYNINSNAGKLLLYCFEGNIKLTAPEIAKKELQDVLQRKLGYTQEEFFEFLSVLPIDWIAEDLYVPLLKNAYQLIKGNDAHFVALAMLSEGVLVTGDKEILNIKSKQIKISTLSEFLKNL